MDRKQKKKLGLNETSLKSDLEKTDELKKSFEKMDLMEEKLPLEDLILYLTSKGIPNEEIAYHLMWRHPRKAKTYLNKSTNQESGYFYRVLSQIRQENSLKNAELAVNKSPENLEFLLYYIDKLCLNLDPEDYRRHFKIMCCCSEVLGGEDDEDDDGEEEEEDEVEARLLMKYEASRAVILTELEGTLSRALKFLFEAGIEAAAYEIAPIIEKLSVLGVPRRFVAQVLYEEGHFIEKSLEFAKAAVEQFPGCFEYRAFFCFLLFEEGKDYSEVITQCEEALETPDKGLEIKSDFIEKIIPTDETRIKRLRVLLGLLKNKCAGIVNGEEDKHWRFEWPWPSYTKEWWASMNKPLETTAAQRGYMKDDNHASSSSSTWDIRKKIHKPKPWNPILPTTRTQLNEMRQKFWEDKQLDGQKDIWDVLRAAAETDDLTVAQALLDNAGVTTLNADLTTCYDKSGATYIIPVYVLSEPTNFIEES